MGFLSRLLKPRIQRLIEDNDREGFVKAMRTIAFWQDPVAIEAIPGMGVSNEEAAGALARLLETSDPLQFPLRRGLLEMIGKYGPDGRSAVRSILKAMADVDKLPEDQVEISAGYSVEREAACLVLAGYVDSRFPQSECVFIGAGAAAILGMEDAGIEEVIKCLSDPDKRIRLQAVRVLRLFGSHGSEISEPLLAFLSEGNEELRRETLITLGFVRHSARKMEDALKACLDDPDERVRTAAQSLDAGK